MILLLVFSTGYSEEQIQYKQIDMTKLAKEVYSPMKVDQDKKYPAFVFFFGGGWINSSIKSFEPHVKYFSQRGMICFIVDHRVKNRHQITPF